MTKEQKIIRAKAGLLELAKQLGNVSQACKMMGYSRDSFYRFKGRLRKVLSVGHERDPILTVPGAGYSFDETFGKPAAPSSSQSLRSARNIDRERDSSGEAA